MFGPAVFFQLECAGEPIRRVTVVGKLLLTCVIDLFLIWKSSIFVGPKICYILRKTKKQKTKIVDGSKSKPSLFAKTPHIILMGVISCCGFPLVCEQIVIIIALLSNFTALLLNAFGPTFADDFNEADRQQCRRTPWGSAGRGSSARSASPRGAGGKAWGRLCVTRKNSVGYWVSNV